MGKGARPNVGVPYHFSWASVHGCPRMFTEILKFPKFPYFFLRKRVLCTISAKE